MTTKTVASDLLAAADYINKNGWCRNEFYQAKGRVCLAGAVGVVTGALVPTTPDKRTKLLKATYPEMEDKTIADALVGKGLFADSYAWDWSKSRSARRRHGAAVTALATQINAERAKELLEQYDVHTARVAGDFESTTEREKYEASRALGRAFVTQDMVTMFNDRNEYVPPKEAGKPATYKRTTKAQAVKLLQRAAAA